MKLLLNEPFKSLWAGRDPFVAVEALQGVVYRELEGRRTLRTEVDSGALILPLARAKASLACASVGEAAICTLILPGLANVS